VLNLVTPPAKDKYYEHSTWRRVSKEYSVGLYGFTPHYKGQEIASHDRPYASLVFGGVSNMYRGRTDNSLLVTNLMVGALGLDVAKGVQVRWHKTVGASNVKGWGNQVSQGGELTLRYAVDYQKPLWESRNVQVVRSHEMSVGYITEANSSVYARFGLITSPWWSFQQQGKFYGERNSSLPHRNSEIYVAMGVIAKLRLHNSFINGQYRESRHVLRHSETKQGLFQAWVSVNAKVGSAFRATLQANIQNSEIKYGASRMESVWGSLTLAFAY
jgi:hypothetical protein